MPAYESAVTECIRGLVSEYFKFIPRTREKLKTLRRGSKQWWRLSAQLTNKSVISSDIPALKDDDKWVLEAAGKANLLERTFASKCILHRIEVNENSALGAPLLTDEFLRIRRRDVLGVKELEGRRRHGSRLLSLHAC